jgi:hypothetical protein
MEPAGTKFCIKCKQTKAALEFHKLTKSKDGLQTYCKLCNIAAARDYFDEAKIARRLARQKKLASTTRGYDGYPQKPVDSRSYPLEKTPPGSLEKTPRGLAKALEKTPPLKPVMNPISFQ